MIFIQCPNDERFRLGIWFGPKPGDEGEAVVSDRDGAGEVSDLGLSRVEDDASHRAFEAHVRRALPRVIRSVDALAVGAAHRTVARLLPDPKGDPRASAAGEARPEAPAGPATKAAPPEYAGTPADEAAIKAFMSHFSPCGS
jgi:hypothetical protein